MRLPRTLFCQARRAARWCSFPPTTGLTAAGTDAGAGNWRMIVLSGPTQFAVAAPGQHHRPRLPGGIERDQDAQSRLTADQRKAIDYWSRGGVLRWNEILLGLVSRYNLPPAPNPDGTYPVPGREQPVCRSAVSVRQSALRGARVQLCHRRAVRRAEGGVVLQIPLQPPVALAGSTAASRR